MATIEADDYEDDREDLDEEEGKSSGVWLELLEHADRKFKLYQDKADNIDKLYSDLEKLSQSFEIAGMSDSEFAMFWANIGVMNPSVYSRAPVPVVAPKFNSRDPIKRTASEMLERALSTSFECGKIDSMLRLIRDDLNIVGRGVPWLRYEDEDKEEVCYDFLDRKDYRHDPARYWHEVDWVARGAYLTRKAMKKRFAESSGDAYMTAAYSAHKDDNNKDLADPKQTCKVWELWCKSQNVVVWVTEGVDVVLDKSEPYLKLEGFFPCPKPAYGTVQRKSLIPVPDVVYYRHQLDEINKLTRRIFALTEGLKVKGFYPGGGEVADAVEAAMNLGDDGRILIPVASFAALGNGNAGIVWLPIEIVAQTITQLIAARRQCIEDVYQITGLSDVMRGATNPNETLGAQQLKSQYGSIRVRDKQSELVRIGADCAKMAGEIMAENFSPDTLLEMSQMDLPTDKDIADQIKKIADQADAQVEQAMSDPQIAQQAQENPQVAQQMLAQLEQQTRAQIEKLKEKPTIDKVMKLLRDQKLRPFAIDIETDSTIQPDEMAEKQRRSEFMTAMGAVMAQVAPMVAQEPGTAQFAGEILRFAVAPFRPGRSMDQAIDEFIDGIQSRARAQMQQPQSNPEAERIKAEMEKEDRRAQNQIAVETAKAEADERRRQQEHQQKMEITAADQQRDTQKHLQDMERGELEITKVERQIEYLDRKGALDMAAKEAEARQNLMGPML